MCNNKTNLILPKPNQELNNLCKTRVTPPPTPSVYPIRWVYTISANCIIFGIALQNSQKIHEVLNIMWKRATRAVVIICDYDDLILLLRYKIIEEKMLIC